MPRLSVEIQHDGLAVVNCVPVIRFENMKRELDRFKVFNVVFIKFSVGTRIPKSDILSLNS